MLAIGLPYGCALVGRLAFSRKNLVVVATESIRSLGGEIFIARNKRAAIWIELCKRELRELKSKVGSWKLRDGSQLAGKPDNKWRVFGLWSLVSSVR